MEKKQRKSKKKDGSKVFTLSKSNNYILLEFETNGARNIRFSADPWTEYQMTREEFLDWSPNTLGWKLVTPTWVLLLYVPFNLIQKPSETPLQLQPSINSRGEPEMIPLSKETEAWVANVVTNETTTTETPPTDPPIFTPSTVNEQSPVKVICFVST